MARRKDASVRRRPNQAFAFQFHGKRSAMAFAGWSWMRARVSASQAWGIDVVELCGLDEGVDGGGPVAAGIRRRQRYNRFGATPCR